METQDTNRGGIENLKKTNKQKTKHVHEERKMELQGWQRDFVLRDFMLTDSRIEDIKSTEKDGITDDLWLWGSEMRQPLGWSIGGEMSPVERERSWTQSASAITNCLKYLF